MQLPEVSATLAQFTSSVLSLEQSRFATMLRLNPQQFQSTFHSQYGTPDAPGGTDADLEMMRLVVALASGKAEPVSLADVARALRTAAGAGAAPGRSPKDWADASQAIRAYLDQAGSMPRPPEPGSIPPPAAPGETVADASAADAGTAGSAGNAEGVVDGDASATTTGTTGDPVPADAQAAEHASNPDTADVDDEDVAAPAATGEGPDEASAGSTHAGTAETGGTMLDRAGQAGTITREEVLWVVVDGLTHGDPERVRQFDAWRSAPPFFTMVEALFVTSLIDLLATLSSMRLHIVQPALRQLMASQSPAATSIIDTR